MIGSLRAVGVNDQVTILCLDDFCQEYLSGLSLPGVDIVGLADLEMDTPGLREVRGGRSKAEYIFTCIPALVERVMKQAPVGGFVAYLDSDVYFFSDPTSTLFEALDECGGSIGLTSHRFPEKLKHLRQYGDFNAGCVVFRIDQRGLRAAQWWAEKCREWCWDYPDAGRYANQGYLDELARSFDGAVVLPAPGLNVAPWNLAGTTIHRVGGAYCLEDGAPLIFFHFHGLRERGGWMYTGVRAFKASADTALLQSLYVPYVNDLEAIRIGGGRLNSGSPTPPSDNLVGTRRSRGMRTLLRRVRGRYVQLLERLRGEAICVK
jgi:hypothetical protein